jgi:hypothetical protein
VTRAAAPRTITVVPVERPDRPEEGDMNKTRTAVTAAVAAALVAAVAAPSLAAADRMALHCDSGTLVGHTLERSNGSSWWDQADGTVYTTTSLVITDDEEEVVHERHYGGKAADPETCTGEHFGSTWHVELVPSAPR